MEMAAAIAWMYKKRVFISSGLKNHREHRATEKRGTALCSPCALWLKNFCSNSLFQEKVKKSSKMTARIIENNVDI
ncbi:MAG: hypothetical protein CVV36_03550 [Candidatus Methanoperedenaceae archaeon HGW-Methanoperedenaceae-1]|jgi:hypothetical protein|nr:MAG: hypothetical protein CVV36_03550 [Candidatus Methanoperedenaceae archaeon HGW-Methanoperedenaceae-1]